MVKKKEALYTITDWRKDNPIEADILDLISAANTHALSFVKYVGGETDDPDDTTVRADDAMTELESTIQRGERAIRLMMEVPQARKVAGLAKKGRGKDKSYDPDSTSLTDPQVQVILEMLRGKKSQENAFKQVIKIISPKEHIDQRTIKRYVDHLIQKWGIYADPDLKSLWVNSPNP